MIASRWSFSLLAVSLAALVASCGGGNSNSFTQASMPQITTQPASETVTAGQTATFSVVATGTAPLTYQWQKNGTPITGATASSYMTPATTTADSGSTFTVIVRNTAGSITSKAATLTVNAPTAGTDVVTYKYDLLRSGQNLAETRLTSSNVAVATFGLLRNLMVDGLVDAQPLYLSALTVSGAAHSVVFVATEHDSVFAFDSDTGAVLWNVSLLGSGETTSDDRGCNQVTPEIGITSTPVIDRNAGAHGTIFVVAMTKDSSSNYHQRLHALDVTTGAELGSSPTEIVATDGASSFAPGQYKERAALLLVNGTIYTSFASHCDIGPYGGWVIAYSESTLAQTSAFNLALNASGSGYANQGPAIWMSGGGPAADSAGNVYLLTANGKFDTTLNAMGFPSLGDYGNSFVKLTAAGEPIAVSDYFAMDGEVAESSSDTDLGSGGIMLLPDMTDAGGTTRHLAVGAGKDGNLYVVDRDNMGKFNASSDSIWQELDGVLPNGIFSTPAYFNSTVYYCPQGGSLMAFPISKAMLASSPASQTSTQFAYPGTFPVVSANGTTNGIVWAYENTSPAVLHAYSAANLATELYNSNQASGGRDQFGSGNKFIAPVVADGKVFAATTNSVAVFGLLP
ncbi:MAG TPA: immunoglobulin domain-containing protein [Steroidobacteraceae bacterium]|nr:immunoglobulin domain-containing protein [Steroidobacteraceae bacterium]